LNQIKSLLDPFNAEGFIKVGNPISMLPALGYSTTQPADKIQDYAIINLTTYIATNFAKYSEMYPGLTQEQIIEEVKNKYRGWYEEFSPDPTDAENPSNPYSKTGKYGVITRTYTEWLSRNVVSEYFRAAYFAHINGIVTLALLYDMLEGNLTERGSLLSAFITGARPVRIDPRPLNNASWGRIGGKLDALFIGAVRGEFAPTTVQLIAAAGGARKTRKAKGTRRQRNRPRGTHKKMAKRRMTRRA
jgi:hypothetical protein